MSRADNRDDSGAPSNAKLAERTARIEENVEHVADTVDRIENAVSEEHDDLAEQVEENRQKVRPLHVGYRLAKYAVPIGVAMVGTVAGMGGF